MTEHFSLWLAKGIEPVPGDTASLERIDEKIDLLSATGGFGVGKDGWTPRLPQVKNGGVYIDNPSIPDRFPVSLTLGNVTETIKLTARASDYVGRYYLETKLARLRKAAHDFWLTDTQQQPVYIGFQAMGAKGAQYARIYSLDIVQTKDMTIPANVNELVITIDREYGWLLIPPGTNPKWASYIINNTESTWLTQSGASLASLYSGTDHLAYGTCYNKQEFNTLTTLLTPNFIDIPAAKIPGDLPALVCVNVEVDDGVATSDVFIAKSTKPATTPDRAANAQLLYNALAASGASIVDGGAFATDTTYGVAHTPNSALVRIYNPSFATTAEAQRLFWTTGAALYPHLNPRVLRGTYAVFVRAWQAGGAAGICNMRLTITSTGDFVFFNSGPVTAQLRSTGFSGLHYMGTTTLPSDVPSTISARGTGSQVEYDLKIILYAQRTTTAGSAVLNVVDVVLMPIDEGFVQIKGDYYTNPAQQPYQAIYDNTGYFSHGKPEDVFSFHGVPAASNEEYSPLGEPLGSQIMLDPNVDNRLYFLSLSRGSDPASSKASAKHDVFINIVPRWSGVRDI